MSRSDKNAIKAYMQYLKDNGYQEVERIQSPADIRAKKNDKDYFFEIKKTSKTKKYFGAATETEWARAKEDPSTYKFVVVQDNDTDRFAFMEYSLDDLRPYCSIPPFKIYFNLDMNKVKQIKYYYNEKPQLPEKGINANQQNDTTDIHMSLNLKDDADNTLFDAIHSCFESHRNQQNNSNQKLK